MDDLVVKETRVITVEEWKLGLRWEGPYVVVASHHPKAYYLKHAIGLYMV